MGSNFSHYLANQLTDNTETRNVRISELEQSNSQLVQQSSELQHQQRQYSITIQALTRDINEMEAKINQLECLSGLSDRIATLSNTVDDIVKKNYCKPTNNTEIGMG